MSPLEAQLRNSLMIFAALDAGLGWEDLCVRLRINNHDARQKLREVFLRLSRESSFVRRQRVVSIASRASAPSSSSSDRSAADDDDTPSPSSG